VAAGALNLLICAEGKERALGEYRRVLGAARFAAVEGWRTGAPLDAILAIR
jgi:hypothetical protein